MHKIGHIPSRTTMERLKVEMRCVTGLDYAIFTPGSLNSSYELEIKTMSLLDVISFLDSPTNRQKILFTIHCGYIRIETTRFGLRSPGYSIGASLSGKESIDEIAEAIQEFYASSKGGDRWTIASQRNWH